MPWPSFYPADCPPDGATQATGEFFRFVKSNPPYEEDFKSNRQMNPHRNYADHETECRSCGLSLFAAWEDMIRMRRRVPGFRSRLVAVGELALEAGVIQSTPSRRSASHHTWWIPVGVERVWDRFRVVEIEEGQS